MKRIWMKGSQTILLVVCATFLTLVGVSCLANPSEVVFSQLTFESSDDMEPAFSPNGNFIAFSSDRIARGQHRIWIMSATGGELHQITSDEHMPEGFYIQHRNPSWSPDDTQIVFEIWIAPVAGGRLRQITTNPADDSYPSLSSTNEIAFQSKRSGNWDIWVARLITPVGSGNTLPTTWAQVKLR
jgi:Tol biopolymer transport system component